MISVNVIGLGRVGLITLFHLTQKGFSVYAVDKNKKYIQALKNQILSFTEPGMQNLLKQNYKKIHFLTSPKDTPYYFICVPTPFNEITKTINLDFISSVLNLINKNSHNKKYVFIRSTLSPGNCKSLSLQFPKLHLSYFPEFLREGHFVQDFKNTRFSVLGCKDSSLVKVFSQFKFPKTSVCSLEEAEILKSYSNLFHALKVSFANEVGRTAKSFNCSPDKIMELFLKDKHLNISKKYLKPGFSFGGPCLKKDISFLQFSRQVNKAQGVLPQSLQKSNQLHTEWVADQILKLKPKSISLLGLSFTGSQTIDYRDSEVLNLMKRLSEDNKNLKIYLLEKTPSEWMPAFAGMTELAEFMNSDMLVLGGWTPLLQKYLQKILKFKGPIFDLLIQDLPQEIKNQPQYTNPYKP